MSTMILLVPQGNSLAPTIVIHSGESVCIGRKPELVDVVVPEATVSRRHAHLAHNGNKCFIFDAQSTNGTHVNDSRITGPVALTVGDRLRIGACHYTVQEEY